ncbi:MAG TPA: glucose-1-phosphate adenylyltransferase [Pirellulaceae bacterium]|nr:glucose-1-phosphate adenylyltransferase [Pirellulaceae bacterium]HMO92465.1 glucose-1-phosphate adenylyltransferase [Pirellulaceae bacterium]HMP67865.1 glucose-1-phosphate adenylyltransferase [Pirellulaceae bacterium]
MRNVVAVVLGGGRGTRLYPLTGIRSKPSVPLAGKYRLIDIPISNCINSQILQIYVLTQFMSVSLHRHIRRTYTFDHFSGGFVEILAAQETEEPGSGWFQGTADAVRKNLRYIQQRNIEYVVILSGDQLYRMDYRDLIKTHCDHRADVTIACRPVTRQAAKAFGVMRLDDTGRVCGFLEKPQTEAELDMLRMEPSWIDQRGVNSNGRDILASMGIYVFNVSTLADVLNKTNYTDFGKEVFPAAIRSRRVQMHLFDGYWEDIGTIRSFYDANLSLASCESPFELFEPRAPVYSRPRFLPPTRMNGATIRHSLVADGCRIGEGTVIENSVIGLRSIIGPNVHIKDSVVMGADYYEVEEASYSGNSQIPIGFGEGSVIRSAIVDKNCRVGAGAQVINSENLETFDDPQGFCMIRDGIPVLVKASEIPQGWRLSK